MCKIYIIFIILILVSLVNSMNIEVSNQTDQLVFKKEHSQTRGNLRKTTRRKQKKLL